MACAPSLIRVFAVRWRKLRSLATHWAHSEDSDQTGRMPRLIWVFAGRTYHFVGFVTRRLKFWPFHSALKGKKMRLFPLALQSVPWPMERDRRASAAGMECLSQQICYPSSACPSTLRILTNYILISVFSKDLSAVSVWWIFKNWWKTLVTRASVVPNICLPLR